MQNNSNSLISINGIQKLLIELNNHLFKINEIILEMNNIINNQMKNTMIPPMNNLINQILNFQNINPNFELNKHLKNVDIVNVTFIKDSFRFNIPVECSTIFNDVLKLYFTKINRPELIDNYKGKITFLWNAKAINVFKKIGELTGGKNLPITIISIIISFIFKFVK